MKGREVLHSSESDEWSTPKEFFNVVDREFHFTLDGAANAGNTKCRNYPGDFLSFDGRVSLLQRIWLNPPYSQCAAFIKKAWDLSTEGHTVVCLIPARTDTKYFQEYCSKATEIRFIKGRLKFGDAKNCAPFPSALVIFNSAWRGNKPEVTFWDWKQ